MIHQTAAIVAVTHAAAAWLCSIAAGGLMATERNKNEWHNYGRQHN